MLLRKTLPLADPDLCGGMRLWLALLDRFDEVERSRSEQEETAGMGAHSIRDLKKSPPEGGTTYSWMRR